VTLVAFYSPPSRNPHLLGGDIGDTIYIRIEGVFSISPDQALKFDYWKKALMIAFDSMDVLCVRVADP
jgi:hypothetical protein